MKILTILPAIVGRSHHMRNRSHNPQNMDIQPNDLNNYFVTIAIKTPPSNGTGARDYLKFAPFQNNTFFIGAVIKFEVEDAINALMTSLVRC